jgi:uncharacterized integral membrane protein
MLTRTTTDRRRSHATGIHWSYIAALILLAALILVVVQNGQNVTFRWLWFDVDASLAVLLLVTALGTMLMTSLGGVVWRRVARHRDFDGRRGHSEAPREAGADGAEAPRGR